MDRPRAAPATAASKARDAALVVAVVVAILAAGVAVLGRRRAPPARPEPGDTLLSTDLALVSGGASARFRVRRPGEVEISVVGPPGAEVKVAVGPPVPPSADGVDRPGEGSAWTAKAGDPPKRLPIFASGHQVLRVEATSSAAPASVRVLVRGVGDGGGPRPVVAE